MRTLPTQIRRGTVTVTACLLAVAVASGLPAASVEHERGPDEETEEEARMLAEAVGSTPDVVREVAAAREGILAAQSEAESRFSDALAGFWLDYAPVPTVTVATVGPVSPADLAAVGSHLPAPLTLDHSVADWPLHALVAAVARITRSDVPGLLDVGVDVRHNRVEVGLAREQFAAAETRVRTVAADVPLHFVVRDQVGTTQLPGNCVARSACFPSGRGGLEMVNATEGGKRCTSGFQATRNGGSVVLTAGHCAKKGSTIAHVSVPWGTMAVSLFSGEYDAGYYSQLSTWTPTNAVYYSDTTKWYTIAGVNPSDMVGDGLCRTGITTNARCGQITHLNVTIKDNKTGTTLTAQTRTNICALPGDSGGPYVFAREAYGMASMGGGYSYDIGGQPHCSSSSFSTYTPLAKVQTKLGVKVRVSAP